MEENEIMNVETEERQYEVITEESWSNENECEEYAGFPIGKTLAVVGGAVAAIIIGRKIAKKKSGGSNKPSFKDRVRYLIKGELPEVGEENIYDEMEDDSYDDVIDEE